MNKEIHERGGKETIADRECDDVQLHAAPCEDKKSDQLQHDADAEDDPLAPVIIAKNGVSCEGTESGGSDTGVGEGEERPKRQSAASEIFGYTKNDDRPRKREREKNSVGSDRRKASLHRMRLSL